MSPALTRTCVAAGALLAGACGTDTTWIARMETRAATGGAGALGGGGDAASPGGEGGAFGGGGVANAGGAAGRFTWTNPVGPQPSRFGALYFDQGRFVYFGSGSGELADREIDVLVSSDGASWERIGTLASPLEYPFCDGGFGAPEVYPVEGRYYLTFSCLSDAANETGYIVGLGVADELLGPYVPVGDGLLHAGAGPTLFRDGEGRTWLLTNGIGIIEVDLATGDALGDARLTVFTPSDVPTDWDYAGTGQPAVIERNGTYFLFYNSWTRGWETGVATSSALEGPWIRSPLNPIYGATSPAVCEQAGLVCDYQPGNPFAELGAMNLFTGPDGGLWLASGGLLRDGERGIAINPVRYDADGLPYIAVTWDEQSVPSQ